MMNSKEKRHPFCLLLLCTLSLILTIYVVSEQIGYTQFYMKYIDTYGKAPKPEDNRTNLDSSANDSGINSQRIKSISILGERNSGTTWIYE